MSFPNPSNPSDPSVGGWRGAALNLLDVAFKPVALVLALLHFGVALRLTGLSDLDGPTTGLKALTMLACCALGLVELQAVRRLLGDRQPMFDWYERAVRIGLVGFALAFLLAGGLAFVERREHATSVARQRALDEEDARFRRQLNDPDVQRGLQVYREATENAATRPARDALREALTGGARPRPASRPGR